MFWQKNRCFLKNHAWIGSIFHTFHLEICDPHHMWPDTLVESGLSILRVKICPGFFSKVFMIRTWFRCRDAPIHCPRCKFLLPIPLGLSYHQSKMSSIFLPSQNFPSLGYRHIHIATKVFGHHPTINSPPCSTKTPPVRSSSPSFI